MRTTLALLCGFWAGRPQSPGVGEAPASTEAERTPVREHRSAAGTLRTSGICGRRRSRVGAALLAAVVVAVGLLGATQAKAQERFASKGTAAFSADRLFGFSLHHEYTQGEGTANTTDLGLVWRAPATDPYEVPRLSFDYFVIHGLEIGGSIAYSNIGGDTGPYSHDAFLFAPRVGYCWMFSRVVGFWLRGGVTYDNIGYRGGAGEWGLAFSAQGMFVISPVNHFAFELGPTLDITMVGKAYDGGRGPSVDRNYRNIGILNFGLMGWL